MDPQVRQTLVAMKEQFTRGWRQDGLFAADTLELNRHGDGVDVAKASLSACLVGAAALHGRMPLIRVDGDHFPIDGRRGGSGYAFELHPSAPGTIALKMIAAEL